jgi:hypothetical protein
MVEAVVLVALPLTQQAAAALEKQALAAMLLVQRKARLVQMVELLVEEQFLQHNQI